MKRIADQWWIVLTRGLASFAFAGALMLASDWSSLGTLTIVFGVWASVDGWGSLALVLGTRGVPIAAYVGRGCLGIAVGILATSLTIRSTGTLYALVSAWAIGTGALEMAFASRTWFVVPRALGFMVIGLVSVAFGMWLLPFPLESVATLRGFLLAFAVVNGIAATVMGERMRSPPRHGLPLRPYLGVGRAEASHA
jgi:uncharacterized membrane protein HdeD (DUF308 family)